jgi:hypothetical protein
MISARRFTQLAGPLVALQLAPGAASLGVALELGDGGIAARAPMARVAPIAPISEATVMTSHQSCLGPVTASNLRRLTRGAIAVGR